MKMASVFLRRGVFYLQSESCTTEGVWIGGPPIFRVDRNEPDLSRKLSDAVSEVLARSREEVPHPTDWSEVTPKPLYELAAVKSWAQFVSGDCRCIRIEVSDNMVRLFPEENRGAKGGFVDCGEPILASAADLSDWENLLAKGFALCKCRDTGLGRR